MIGSRNYKELTTKTKFRIASQCYNHTIKTIQKTENDRLYKEGISDSVERDGMVKMMESPVEEMKFWIDIIKETEIDHKLNIEVNFDKYSYRSIFDILFKKLYLFDLDSDSLTDKKRRYLLNNWNEQV